MIDISRDEYINALKVIEQYHSQIIDKINFITDYGKINIDDFLDWGADILAPSMYKAISEYKSTFKAKFIEDIDFNKLINYKNIGEKSIESLKILIKKYKTTL